MVLCLAGVLSASIDSAGACSFDTKMPVELARQEVLQTFGMSSLPPLRGKEGALSSELAVNVPCDADALEDVCTSVQAGGSAASSCASSISQEVPAQDQHGDALCRFL